MLAEWRPSDELALASAQKAFSWSELLYDIRDRVKRLEQFKGQRVGLLMSPTPQCIAEMLACQCAGVHAFLMAGDSAVEKVAAWAETFGLSMVSEAADNAQTFDHFHVEGSPDAITILTSGTTGEPKAVQHSWASLTRPVRQTTDQYPVWLLTYRPHLYAGLQVMMQCLMNQGCLVMPQPGDTADEVAELGAQSNVEFASATPSYWRWLLTFASEQQLSKLNLTQITLGGEAVDQPTLDALHGKFPNTRLVHIYATTELGRCFSVTDGQAGFPARFLDEISRDGVEMEIVDGELVVRSANAMKSYDGGTESPQENWFNTGDLVRVHGDRVHFVGRKTEMINVGGNKVYPLAVENVIRQIAGVADVRVYGEKSSILGELVKCDVVLQEGHNQNMVESELRTQCREKLTNYENPRFVTFVDEIPRTAAGKADRG